MKWKKSTRKQIRKKTMQICKKASSSDSNQAGPEKHRDRVNIHEHARKNELRMIDQGNKLRKS